MNVRGLSVSHLLFIIISFPNSLIKFKTDKDFFKIEINIHQSIDNDIIDLEKLDLSAMIEFTLVFYFVKRV